MITDAEKIEVQKAELGGAEIERNPRNWEFQWELAPLPIEWNWVDFEFRVAEVKPVSAFMEYWEAAGLVECREYHATTFNAGVDACRKFAHEKGYHELPEMFKPIRED